MGAACSKNEETPKNNDMESAQLTSDDRWKGKTDDVKESVTDKDQKPVVIDPPAEQGEENDELVKPKNTPTSSARRFVERFSNPFKKANPLNPFNKSAGDAKDGTISDVLFFTNEEEDENINNHAKFMEYLEKATQSMDICVFTITDNKIRKLISRKQQEGVEIRIITDDDKVSDAGSDIVDFKTLGIPVKVDKTEAHMHHKFAIIDKKLLLNGSFNWTVAARKRNFENVMITNDDTCVKKFNGEFEKLWESTQISEMQE